ncbi:transposable element Tcb1 transposase [Trichonephila clavipes]|nr:transposable element Tcb1 transposase [Trichonephila clavipes]
MSRSKQRSAFDEISEFDRGGIVANRDCGLSFIDIGSRVAHETKKLVCAYHLMPFTAEWSVRKTSIALSNLDSEPQTSPSPMIELLPWPARVPDLSPIENMWSMLAQRLTQITPPAATPDQLWQRVKATWSAVPQEHIQSLFE